MSKSPIFDSAVEIIIFFTKNNFQKPDGTHSLFLTFCLPSYLYNVTLGQSTSPYPLSRYLELEFFSLFLDPSLPDFSFTPSTFPRHTISSYGTKLLQNFPLFPLSQVCQSHDSLSNSLLIVQCLLNTTPLYFLNVN